MFTYFSSMTHVHHTQNNHETKCYQGSFEFQSNLDNQLGITNTLPCKIFMATSAKMTMVLYANIIRDLVKSQSKDGVKEVVSIRLCPECTSASVYPNIQLHYQTQHVFQLQEPVQQSSLVLHQDKRREHVASLFLPTWSNAAGPLANSSILLMLKLYNVLTMFLELMSKLDDPRPGLLTALQMTSFCIASHTCCGVHVGCACKYSAATLATCRDAMDVPDMKFVAMSPIDQADKIPSLGAKMFMHGP